MTSPITVWLEISHHAAFRVGGWAFVRKDGVSLVGHAGGERRVGAEGATLAGLVAGLRDRPGGAATRIYTASPLLAAIPVRIRSAQAGQDPPTENLDLWAQAITALAWAPVEIVASSASQRP